MSQIKKRNEWVVLTFLLVGSCCVVEEEWERMTIMTRIDMYVSHFVVVVFRFSRTTLSTAIISVCVMESTRES